MIFRIAASILTLLCVAATGDVTAQIRGGKVAFQRNDRLLTWQTDNSGNFDLTDRVGLELDSVLSTSLSMTKGRNVKDRWYKSVKNGAKLSYRLSDKTGLVFAAREDWNKDTMSMLGNKLFTMDFSGGMQYRPVAGLAVNGSVGQEIDRRFDNRDSGAKIEGGIKYTATPTGNLSLDFSGAGETSRMKRERNTYRNYGRIMYRRETVDYSLTLSDDYNRRGYFSDIDRTTVERRKRREQQVVFSVHKGDFEKIDSSTVYEVSVNLGRKLITDTANDDERSSKFKNDAKGDEKGFGFRIGKRLARRLAGQWGMDYSKVANGVERLSRRRTQTDIGTRGSLYFGFGRADSVEVASMMGRTRIDTPIGFANDRDEFKLETGVTYTRHFSDMFKTALDFRVLETHYVNIDVSQSSQNKWMKTYLFSPSLVYSPLRSLRIEHAINVYANYNTYDFDRDDMPRSNISRRLTSESWVDYTVSPRTLVRMGMMLEDNDYGTLNSKGDKLPAEEGLKRYGDVTVEYRFTRWLTVAPNYIYAIRRDWEVNDEDTSPIRREIDQTYGLTCRLFANENGAIDLSIRRIVRNAVQHQFHRKYTRIRNYVTLRVSYGF